MKATIVQLKSDITDAKSRHELAVKDVKRIERDMNEFSNNKDSKLAELQTSLDKLKKTLTKGNASIKPLQQEMRDAMLESEQCGGDLSAAQEQLHDIEVNIAAQKEEIDGQVAEQCRVKVTIMSESLPSHQADKYSGRLRARSSESSRRAVEALKF
jgi:structural maintenance of chromosome 2